MKTKPFTLKFEYIRSLGDGRLGFGYLRIRREDFKGGIQEGRSRLIMPGLRFTERGYDDLIRPKKGYRYELEFRGTNKFFGSDTNFLQFLIGGDLIVHLPLKFILFTRGQGGFTLLSDLFMNYLFLFGSLQEGIDQFVDMPKDSSGKVVGSKHLLVGSIEFERAIAKSLGLAAFYDVGNAFSNFGKIDPQHGVGVGIRLYTPVGPIRLDLARQIGVKDPKFRIHLTVGFGF
jgi:translocation and assembly module TamA